MSAGCCNPDNISSLRLYDGDMYIIMRKQHEIDMKNSEIGSTLAAMVQEVRIVNTVSSRMTGDSESSHDVNISTADCVTVGYAAPEWYDWKLRRKRH